MRDTKTDISSFTTLFDMKSRKGTYAMERLFLIEDDGKIARNLILLLRGEGFTVSYAATCADALAMLSGSTFDIALMDILLPDGNGYMLCTEIKEKQNIPVIFLTASGDESSVVTGLNMGADDYVTKPFRPRELTARIRAALRKSGGAPAVFELQGLRIDMTGGTVHKNGEEVMLSALEYRQLLVQVMQSANRTGVDIKALVHGMRLQPESSRAERLESGRRVLMNYLKARGITDSIVQQEICDLITKEQPYMLENLYMADFCGSEDTGRAYDLVMECYTGCKTEMTLMEYLEKYGVTDPAEQQEIYGMLLEKHPSMLQDLYRAVKQGSGDADEPEGL